jgi:hypothetical protein
MEMKTATRRPPPAALVLIGLGVSASLVGLVLLLALIASAAAQG